MSVSAIYGSNAVNQLTALSSTGVQKNTQTQPASEDTSYSPTDITTLQQTVGASSGSTAGLSTVEKAYDSLRRISNDPREVNHTTLPMGPRQAIGSPVRRLPVTANPVAPTEVEDPLMHVTTTVSLLA